MRYAQVVVGPAGSGKSTYCATLERTSVDHNRTIKVVNLDPAAEDLAYEPFADIRNLIHVEDAMEEEKLGPNGGLILCMEYLLKNTDWLKEVLGDVDEDYFVFDCPGQIELYTHMSTMKEVFMMLSTKLLLQVCGVFIIDSEIVIDGPRFLSGTMAAVSTWSNLEIPFINIMTKIDILSTDSLYKLDKYLEPDVISLLEDLDDNSPIWNKKYKGLSFAIANIIEENSCVRFWPLNITDDDSIADILLCIDNLMQYGENDDVKTKDFESNYGLGL